MLLSRGSPSTQAPNLVITQPARMTATLRRHVSLIVGDRPHEQVVRVEAASVVALMADAKIRLEVEQYLLCNVPMEIVLAVCSGNMDYPVAFGVVGSEEFPAPILEASSTTLPDPFDEASGGWIFESVKRWRFSDSRTIACSPT